MTRHATFAAMACATLCWRAAMAAHGTAVPAKSLALQALARIRASML